MLSIVASEKWGHDYGPLYKIDGTPYRTEKGAFRNHPCTKWTMDQHPQCLLVNQVGNELVR
jgi:hypothetical protein